MGRLYRTWGGSSSERFLWKMIAQTIKPQTTIPTPRAATHEPCQRVSMALPCCVTGRGMPSRVHAVARHPVTLMSSNNSTPARGTQRRGSAGRLSRSDVRRLTNWRRRTWVRLTMRNITGPPGRSFARSPVFGVPTSVVIVAYLDAASAEPARLYRDGRRARLLLDQARERVASILGCRADELSFTSSGTLAVQLAVLGTARARRRGRNIHIAASAVEHSSVLHAVAACERDGAEATIVGVDRQGRVDPSEFAAALRPGDTVLACLQSANHEVGTLQPVCEAASASRYASIPLLVDATASAGNRAPRSHR